MRTYSLSSVAVIAVTFVLFSVALFTKGFTHDLLLEAAIFLVSVKLIHMSYLNKSIGTTLQKELRELRERIDCEGE